MRPANIRLFYLSILLVLASLSVCSDAETTRIQREIAPGIRYTQEITTGDAPLLVNILEVDLKARGVQVKVGQARDVISYSGEAQGRETVSHLAGRTGAFAAINGDYFPYNGDPTSLEIRDGELLSEPIGYRAGFGLEGTKAHIEVVTSRGTVRTADGSVLALDGINHLPHDKETVLLTPAYAATPALKLPCTILRLTEVKDPFRVSQEVKAKIAEVQNCPQDTPLPPCAKDELLVVAVGEAGSRLAACKPDDRVSLRYELLPVVTKAAASDVRPIWQKMQQAIGGGPWLVKDGVVYVDGAEERFSPAEFVNARHPRTAIGIKKNGHLLLVTVDGRKKISRGATLPEMAQIMLRLGAQQAMNLDGGGSTDMVVAGGVVNTPSDGTERPVVNALLVFASVPESESVTGLSKYRDFGDAIVLHAGQSRSLHWTDSSGKPLTIPILWGTENGLGFVSQGGVFSAYSAGKGVLYRQTGGTRFSTHVTVLPAAPAHAKAVFGTPLPDNPNSTPVTLTITDAFGNAVPDITPAVTVSSGVMSRLHPTNAKGHIQFTVEWASTLEKRKLLVALPGEPPLEFSP